MKRVNGLFTQITDFQNLYLAFKKALRGSPHTLEAKQFTFFMEEELLALQSELLATSYRTGEFRHYIINDPKKRLISVAPFRDRVVHHAVVRILEPVYEPVFIYDSYATRKNKGTHAAIIRTQQLLKNAAYYLKTDIRKHFENMDHDVLMRILEQKIKDRKCLQLINTIIKGVPWEKGLPIGNLTSQFFANVYLNPVDHYIKEVLKVKKYVRYMDDMVFLSDSKNFLKTVQNKVDHYLEKQLKLKLKKSAVYTQVPHLKNTVNRLI